MPGGIRPGWTEQMFNGVPERGHAAETFVWLAISPVSLIDFAFPFEPARQLPIQNTERLMRVGVESVAPDRSIRLIQKRRFQRGARHLQMRALHENAAHTIQTHAVFINGVIKNTILRDGHETGI